jgi:hypothetical protein
MHHSQKSLKERNKLHGTKHIVECHCTLPQYRNRKDTVYHKFIVFSILDDSDTVIPKHVQCNNCDVVHEVYDICKSNIVAGRDELGSIMGIDDIKLMVNNDVARVLENYEVDLATWEEAKFILAEKKWGKFVVLSKDTLDNSVHGKRLVFQAESRATIEPFTYTEYLDS